MVMTKHTRTSDGLEAGYFERLPEATRAAYAFWLSVDGAVPLDVLLVHASASLRRSIEAREPLVLDFAAVVNELFSTRGDVASAEAA